MPEKTLCKRCGECCLSPRLYPADIKCIEKAGYKNFYETDFGVQFMKVKNKKCIFLKKSRTKTSCTIYKLRPKVCKQYPRYLVNNDCKPYLFIPARKLKF